MTVRPLNNLSSLALAMTLAFSALGVSGASAQTYSDIHDFAASTLSSPLYTGILAQGRDGNVYGTAPSGGTLGFGGVLKSRPPARIRSFITSTAQLMERLHEAA